MTTNRHTSANQFAKMLERRAAELRGFAERMHMLRLDGSDVARRLVYNAASDLDASVRVLRQPPAPKTDHLL